MPLLTNYDDLERLACCVATSPICILYRTISLSLAGMLTTISLHELRSFPLALLEGRSVRPAAGRFLGVACMMWTSAEEQCKDRMEGLLYGRKFCCSPGVRHWGSLWVLCGGRTMVPERAEDGAGRGHRDGTSAEGWWRRPAHKLRSTQVRTSYAQESHNYDFCATIGGCFCVCGCELGSIAPQTFVGSPWASATGPMTGA